METILIQEPDAAIFDVMSTALRMEGYHICHLDGQQENMLEMIRRHHIKLILLDSWLIQHSAKLCQWIKSHFPHLPVVAFSCDNAISEQFRSAGFDAYLKKPFELEELYDVARRFLPARKKRAIVEEETVC